MESTSGQASSSMLACQEWRDSRRLNPVFISAGDENVWFLMSQDGGGPRRVKAGIAISPIGVPIDIDPTRRSDAKQGDTRDVHRIGERRAHEGLRVQLDAEASGHGWNGPTSSRLMETPGEIDDQRRGQPVRQRTAEQPRPLRPRSISRPHRLRVPAAPAGNGRLQLRVHASVVGLRLQLPRFGGSTTETPETRRPPIPTRPHRSKSSGRPLTASCFQRPHRCLPHPGTRCPPTRLPLTPRRPLRRRRRSAGLEH